ncbi:MAG: DUF4367 domain-containing protein [Desulfotomaculaceae bacterium]|nr:DUF4367 domain-containing protein [Desulfotomaculaceae bacterium]
MLCDNIRDWFNDYLDGDLTLKKKQIVDDHLSQCSKCHQEFEMLKHIDARLRQEIRFMFEDIPVPGSLPQKIEDRLDLNVKASFFRLLQSYRRYTGIAAALIVFATAYGIFQQYFSSTPIPNFISGNSPQVIVENINPTGSSDALPGDSTSLSRDESSGQSIQNKNHKEDMLFHDSNLPAKPEDTSGVDATYSSTGALDRSLPQETDALPGTGKADGPNVGGGTSGDTRAIASKISSEATPPAGGETMMADKAATGLNNEGRLNLAATPSGCDPLLPGYLPEGAKLIKADRQEDTVRLYYTAGQMNFFIEESPAQGNKTSTNGLTNGKKVKINELDGFLLNKTPSGEIGLSWQSDHLLLTIQGNLSENELIKIAESM